MINDQLLGYIRLQLSQNVPKETIISSLKSQGWTDADINEAFGALTSVSPTSTASSSPQSKKMLFVVLLLILLGGGSAAGYFLYLKPQSEALVVAPEQEAGQEIEQTLKTLPASNSETESTGENNVKKTTTIPVPENYLTYENSGLKFRYPSDWTIVPDSRSDEDIFMINLKTPKVESKYGGVFIGFSKKVELPVAGLVQFEQNGYQKDGFTLSNMKIFKFAGMNGSTFTATKTESGVTNKSVVFINGRLSVNFAGSDKVHSKYDDILMIILNSMEIK